MANKKISDLTSLAAADVVDGDLIEIVDISEASTSDQNKKMTYANLFDSAPDFGQGFTASNGLNLGVVDVLMQTIKNDQEVTFLSGQHNIGGGGTDDIFSIQALDNNNVCIYLFSATFQAASATNRSSQVNFLYNRADSSEAWATLANTAYLGSGITVAGNLTTTSVANDTMTINLDPTDATEDYLMWFAVIAIKGDYVLTKEP